MFMCRDPGDSASKVSCCVEPSYCFKHSDFDAIVKVPVELPLKMSLTRKNENTVNLETASFVVIMLLYEGLTRVHSQKKPRLHFGKNYALITII